MSIHLGIIPDGNRRWCKRNGVEIFDLMQMMYHMFSQSCNEGMSVWSEGMQQVSEVSIYILSKDNLIKRTDNTLDMIRQGLQLFANDMHKPEYFPFKIQFVGELHLLPEDIIALCKSIELQTFNGKFVITAAIAYDALEDTRKVVENNSQRPDQNNIDLVIRTGGEMRSSGFFPMHTLYSEWIYLEKLWPDITPNDIVQCLKQYSKRSRRFGQ